MAKSTNKKGSTPMEDLTAGYEKFVSGKHVNNNEKEQFDKAVRKSIKKKTK